MKLCKPFKTATPKSITQGYSPSHLANDFTSAYGTFLVSPFNGKVNVITGAETITTNSNPSFELKRGNGIRIVSIEDPTISVMYWHTLPFFPVKVGDTVLQGQVIAMMGNSGYVESNGIVVPYELRDNAPYLGTHVHITIGTATEYWDYSKLIDWNIEIKYDIITTIKSIIQNMSNFLSGK